MKKLFPFLFLVLPFFIQAQETQIVWQANAGGTSYDVPYDMSMDSASNFTLVGYTKSTDMDAAGIHSNYYEDVFVAKFDKSGNKLWAKCYGGTSSDVAYGVYSTDSAIYVTGFTWSNDGDIEDTTASSQDIWLLQLSQGGDIISERRYGDKYNDVGQAICHSNTNNLLIAGTTLPSELTTYYDAFIMEVTHAGDSLWSKSFGGKGTEQFRSIAVAQGTIIAAGISDTDDTSFIQGYGSADFLVGLFNNQGDLRWIKRYGGSNYDEAKSITVVNDTFFVVAGNSYSSDSMVRENRGGNDWWIVALNANGDTLWTRTLGGSHDDLLYKIILTHDKNLLLVGSTESYDGDVHDLRGGKDIWVVKMNLQGDTIWTKCIGSKMNDEGTGIVDLGNNKFVVSGYTQDDSRDVTVNYGLSDFWIAQLTVPTLNYEPTTEMNDLVVYPNPSENIIHLRSPVQGQYTVDIVDINGRVIMTKNLNTKKASINISSLSKGLYLLRLTQKQAIYQAKFVVGL